MLRDVTGVLARLYLIGGFPLFAAACSTSNMLYVWSGFRSTFSMEGKFKVANFFRASTASLRNLASLYSCHGPMYIIPLEPWLSRRFPATVKSTYYCLALNIVRYSPLGAQREFFRSPNVTALRWFVWDGVGRSLLE